MFYYFNLLFSNMRILEEKKLCQDLTVDSRFDQLKEINEFIIEQYNEGRITYNDNVILLGDFNVDATNFKMKIEVKFIINEKK